MPKIEIREDAGVDGMVSNAENRNSTVRGRREARRNVENRNKSRAKVDTIHSNSENRNSNPGARTNAP